MPTIKEFDRCRLVIYPRDHAPPHFHLLGPDIQAVVRIADSAIMAGEFRARDMADALLGRQQTAIFCWQGGTISPGVHE